MENYPFIEPINPDPVRIGEVLEDPDAVVGFAGDTARQRDVNQKINDFEVDALTRQREDLLNSIEAGSDEITDGVRTRLSELNQMILEARADGTENERKPLSTEPEK